MTEEVRRENKYVVIKIEDAQKYLSPDEQSALDNLCWLINEHRGWDGKKLNNYIVCNQDEPYAEAVWQLILEGERKKREAK